MRSRDTFMMGAEKPSKKDGYNQWKKMRDFYNFQIQWERVTARLLMTKEECAETAQQKFEKADRIEQELVELVKRGRA